MKPADSKASGRGWAYTGAILGGAVSIAANVAHSFIAPAGAPAGWQPPPGAVVGAIVWPVFLFIAVEILARYAWPKGPWWTVLRFGGMTPVTLVAAFVSYRHLSGLLAHYGEDPIIATIGPLAVDGLMVMATGAILATGARARRERAANTEAATTAATLTTPAVATSADDTPARKPRTTRKATTAKAAAGKQPAKTTRTRKPSTKTAPATDDTPITPDQTPAVSTPEAPAVAASPAKVIVPPTPALPAAASATDTKVDTADAARLKPPVPASLLTRARHLADAHLDAEGTPITAPKLAARLRVNSEVATQLLAVLNLDPDRGSKPVTPVNGNPVGALR